MTVMPSTATQLSPSPLRASPGAERDPFTRDDAPRFDDVLGAMLGGGAARATAVEDSVAAPVRTTAEMFNENGFFHGVQATVEPTIAMRISQPKTTSASPSTVLTTSSLTPSADSSTTDTAVHGSEARAPTIPVRVNQVVRGSSQPSTDQPGSDLRSPAVETTRPTSTPSSIRVLIASLFRRGPFSATPRPHSFHPVYPIGPGGGHMADIEGEADSQHCGTSMRPTAPKMLPKTAAQPAAHVLLQDTSQGLGIVARLDRASHSDRARLRDRIAAVLARHGYAIDFIRVDATRRSPTDHRLEG